MVSKTFAQYSLYCTVLWLVRKKIVQTKGFDIGHEAPEPNLKTTIVECRTFWNL